MNRRELFKGFAAAVAIAALPIPVQLIETLPDTQALSYLRKVRTDLVYKIIYPPCTMAEDGTLTMMDTKPWTECLVHVNKLIKELEG